MAHTRTNKDQLIARLRRIGGQIAAVERALENEVGCAAILQQVAGVRGAVAGLMDEIVEQHVREHVAHPGLDDAEREAGAEELIAVIRRYSR